MNVAMLPFTFHASTKIIFAEYSTASAGDIVKELGGKKIFVITDHNLVKVGLLKPLLDGLKGNNLTTVIFDQVPADSDLLTVTNASKLACAEKCDSIIALGGGSVIDTSKAVNICLSYGGDIKDYEGLNNLPTKLSPLICIPTTAGTGSEVSAVAMIRNHQEGKKMLFGSRYLAPDVAILDPVLLLTLPAKLTAACGIDALTHCLESLAAVSTASVITDSLALPAAAMLFNNLEQATNCGDDLKARSSTLIASTMAGLAFTNAGVGIVHALAHTIGGVFGTHHGMTNAIFLPYGLEVNSQVIAHKYAYAARYLGISNTKDDKQATSDLIASVSNLIKRCGLPQRLRDLNVPVFKENELEKLAEIAMTDPAIMFNPREITKSDIIDIYKRAY